ncbi:protein of unknown function [Paenibacillus alvei]|uniref:Uncharacterized protein n=1 Tax=Paenibacillus alvei TaxID=44250 RepID=A0A383R926_PAEAL|nr:protein of unknown function [Paenibacillus alvei]
MPTLFHVVDVEWSWIRVLQGKKDFEEGFEKYNTLEKISQLDEQFRPDVEEFVRSWNDCMETRPFYDHRPDGTVLVYAGGEVMRHTISPSHSPYRSAISLGKRSREAASIG